MNALWCGMVRYSVPHIENNLLIAWGCVQQMEGQTTRLSPVIYVWNDPPWKV
jgi:hypothetical protein